MQLTEKYRLWEFPSSSNMNDSLYNTVTVIVDETERATLIGYSQSELIVVNQTDLSKNKK